MQRVIRHTQTNSSTKSDSIPTKKKKSLSETLQQYLITTRTNTQPVRRSKNYITHTDISSPASTRRNLVDIEC
jgi:hypothetical protein